MIIEGNESFFDERRDDKVMIGYFGMWGCVNSFVDKWYVVKLNIDKGVFYVMLLSRVCM